jgi:hypothetical protein
MPLEFQVARPPWLRGFNAVGRAWRKLGLPPVNLDPDELQRTAQRRAGLTDFGGDEFVEPMRRFFASLEEEAQLSWMGRLMARQDALCVLDNRLRMTALFGRHPEILDESVSAPIFITGLPRSGTTILHELLAEDPAHRVPLCWQTRYAVPAPADSPDPRDPRIRRTNRDLRFWHRLVPAHATMHQNGAELPSECADLTAHTFLGDRYTALYQVPSFAAWSATQDPRVMYRWHRKLLQLLQWRRPPARWVLKAPAHMNWLDALLDVYPDARVVQSHRDPLQVMGSVASLLLAILWMRADGVDPAGVEAAFGGASFAAQLDAALRVRDEPGRDPGRFVDIRYLDLMRDPLAAIHTLYAALGQELDPAAEHRMRAYLDAKPQGKYGRHVYRFADLGLDLALERARFAAYQARFDVASEVCGGVE